MDIARYRRCACRHRPGEGEGVATVLTSSRRWDGVARVGQLPACSCDVRARVPNHGLCPNGVVFADQLLDATTRLSTSACTASQGHACRSGASWRVPDALRSAVRGAGKWESTGGRSICAKFSAVSGALPATLTVHRVADLWLGGRRSAAAIWLMSRSGCPLLGVGGHPERIAISVPQTHHVDHACSYRQCGVSKLPRSLPARACPACHLEHERTVTVEVVLILVADHSRSAPACGLGRRGGDLTP